MKHTLTRTRIGVKRHIHWIIIVTTCVFTSNAHARNYSFSDYLKARAMPTVVSLGLITTTSALASQSPKATGIGMVALSPFVGLRRYGRRGALSGIISTAGIAGLGWYNFDELAKDKYSKTRVFEKNMVIMSGALGIGLLLESAQYALGFEPQSNFNLVPVNEGITLNYSYRF